MLIHEFTSSSQPVTVPPEKMTVVVQRIGNISVFRCVENMSDDDVERLSSAISSHSRGGEIVLDFAEVSVLDSVWLGTLVTAAACATASGTRLRLMNVRPPVEAVLDQNNLLSAFDICSPNEVVTLWCHAVCRGQQRV